MLRIKFLLSILALTLLLSACGRATHHYVDNKDVKIDSIKHVKDGDFLVVTAALVNKTSGIQNSVYKIQWFDANGMLAGESSWKPIILKGDVPTYIKERSTIPSATEYTILISNDAS